MALYGSGRQPNFASLNSWLLVVCCWSAGRAAARQVRVGLREAGRVHHRRGDAREGLLHRDGDARSRQDTPHDTRQRQRLRRPSRQLPGRRLAQRLAAPCLLRLAGSLPSLRPPTIAASLSSTANRSAAAYAAEAQSAVLRLKLGTHYQCPRALFTP